MLYVCQVEKTWWCYKEAAESQMNFFIGYKPRAVKISKKAVYMYVVYMAVSGELFSSYSFAVYR